MKILQYHCGSGRSSNHSDNFFQKFFYELAGEFDPFGTQKDLMCLFPIKSAQNSAPTSLCWHWMWRVSASRFVTSIRSCLYRNSLKLMYDNAPSHSVEGTISYFATFGLEETTSMTSVPFSSALNPIEQLLATLKMMPYGTASQYQNIT